jgi:hypothetical protein
MSYSACIHGGACTGCMACQDGDEEIFECADCGDELDPEDMYEDDGDKLCRCCLLSRFRVPA